MLTVPLRDIAEPRSLWFAYEHHNDPAPTPLVLIYTGWVMFEYARGEYLDRETVISFLPNSDGTLRNFHPSFVDRIGHVRAAVTAAPSSFSIRDEGGGVAVDSAVVALQQLVNLANDPSYLVLRSQIAARDGALLRIAYQVTVEWDDYLLRGQPAGGPPVSYVPTPDDFSESEHVDGAVTPLPENGIDLA